MSWNKDNPKVLEYGYSGIVPTALEIEEELKYFRVFLSIQIERKKNLTMNL